MALLTTAAQVQMMVDAWRPNQDRMVEIMRQVYYPSLFDLIFKRLFPRRPHTDDMMQMLADIGIEPPERNWTSPDGLTFIWRR